MPLPSTMTPIATQTLTADAASVTFSSLPQGYTDLMLVINSKGSVTNYPAIRVNGDTGTNYSRTYLTGNGTAASSGRDTTISLAYINANSGNDTSNFNYVGTAHFMNYSNTTTYKTFLGRSSNAGSGADATVNLWRSTAAITSITALLNTGNYSTGSIFTLYGIKAA